MDLAKIHEDATMLGKETYHGVSCVCCGSITGKTEFDWKGDSVQVAVNPMRGVTVPLLFSLMKFYIISIILIFTINGIVTLYEYRRLCSLHSDKCAYIYGIFPIMDNSDLEKLIDPDSLSALQWLDFTTYLTVLFC